ncbi:MAG: beta-hydroxyacyl-ACP dehydratase [Desulfobulbus propionicus]|nr:MAG: beta-hydroxyacyl-ACP dehydratase [Desulfobulbus propionicus]
MRSLGLDFIASRIPHRPPFLWLDEVTAIDGNSIKAVKTIAKDLELFQGHYPHYPIVPGVILCEAVFQAGAVLISDQLSREQGEEETGEDGIPVLTRISGAKFKREVRPGDTITIEAGLVERMQAAWFMKGSVKVNDKVAVKVEFACTQTKGN